MEDSNSHVSETIEPQPHDPVPAMSAAPSHGAVADSTTPDDEIPTDQIIAGLAKTTIADVPAANKEAVQQKRADVDSVDKCDLSSCNLQRTKSTENPIVTSVRKEPSTKGRLPDKVLLALAKLEVEGISDLLPPPKPASLATQTKASATHDVAEHPLNRGVFGAKLPRTPRRGVELPDEDNEYYLTWVTLGGAAERMHVNLHKIWVNCKHCVEDLSAAEVKELLCKLNSGLKKTCQKLNFMAQFLRCGRLGFDFTHWPDAFFNYAVSLLTDVIAMGSRLAAMPGCHALEQEAVAPAQYVQRRLVEIHRKRIQIGKQMREAEVARRLDVTEGEEERRHRIDCIGIGLHSIDDKEQLVSPSASSTVDGRKKLNVRPRAKRTDEEDESVDPSALEGAVSDGK